MYLIDETKKPHTTVFICGSIEKNSLRLMQMEIKVHPDLTHLVFCDAREFQN